MIRYGIKQQPTLEELSNLHLAGVVWQPSQLHHGVLAAVLRQAPPRPRVTGVLHLRVLRTDITLHYIILHYITFSCNLTLQPNYLTLKHFNVSFTHVTLVLLQGSLNVCLVLHLNEGLP